MRNNENAIRHFQEILRVPTISRWTKEETDWSAFDRFLPLLKELYPAVFEHVDCRVVNDYGILLHWKGRNSSLAPALLMAHYDVVPVEGQDWDCPPFVAEIQDGKIYGRGSVDTKCILAAVLEAMEELIRKGHTPEQDIYFASSNCEEVAGDTTPKIVEWFQEQGITPAFVLDEGGAILEKMPMGIKTPFAMIGVAEKGLCNVTIEASGKAGHASLPSKNDATVKLVQALHAIQKKPFQATLTPALKEMLRCFADHVSFGVGLVFRNLWLFGPVVKKVMEGNLDTAAMIRSTAGLTQLSGSDAINVIPEKATASFSVRIAPQDSVADVATHLQMAIGDKAVVHCSNMQEPSPISSHKTASYRYIRDTVTKVYPGVESAPYLMNACTDARHFAGVCEEVYRFAGFVFTEEQRASIHSANEFMPVEAYLKGIDFYKEFLSGL